MTINKTVQLIIITTLFMLQYVAEHLFPESGKNNIKKNEWQNLKWGLMGWGVNIFPAIGLAKWLQWLHTTDYGLMKIMQLPAIGGLLIFILLMDLWMYWWHRWNHTVTFLWLFHRLHHTEEHMNTTTVLRFHFAELLFSNVLKAIVFFILGPSVFMVAVYELLFFANVLFHHSNVKLSLKSDKIYRLLFSSPYMHRLHHSTIKKERNSNYGSVFSWWDRLFGSFKNNANPQIIFGISDETIVTPNK